MESDHGLEKNLGIRLELEFKSMEPDWIRTPKKVTPLISATNTYINTIKTDIISATSVLDRVIRTHLKELS